ncbi:MAG TPA: 6-phosphogluconolactonase [Ktedonobacterales bacterium]
MNGETGGPSSGGPTVRVFDDVAALSRAAADALAEVAAKAVRQHGRFRVALSGGSTPQALFKLLAHAPYHDRVSWSRTFVFWGDERCVPPTSADSNYRMARETLLFHVPVPATQVYRMPGEAADPEAGARLYEMSLRRAFALAPGEMPRFDLILLGMGSDGHTASLFPHTSALRVTDRLVVANRVEKLNTTRLTLTVPVLNNAATVLFLVAGDDKAGALKAVLRGPKHPEEYPAQLVAPHDGELVWLVDRAAAAGLVS